MRKPKSKNCRCECHKTYDFWRTCCGRADESRVENIVSLQKSGLTIEEYVKKYCPDCELMIVNKKDVEKVKFYIKQLNDDGYHDVEEFYKE